MGGWLSRVGLVLLLGAGASCSRPPRHTLASVEISGETLQGNVALGLDAAAVRQRLVLKLRESGRFTEPPDSRVMERGARLSLELGYTREAVRKPREGTWAETGARLQVETPLGDESLHDELVGVGEAQVTGDALELRREALQLSLDRALESVVASADLLLRARTRPDADLAAQLQDGDGRVREYALQVLAERKSALAVPGLLERLRSTDGAQVRRAMGALVEMREKQAVPVLIDLGRHKEPTFLREIVFALGELGGEEAEAWLFTVSRGHDLPAIREAAGQALDDLRRRPRR
ncbi:MAG: hypothetical protein RL653_1297 [Pseudomonadota bacterium]|jgi:hypothetical protein